MVLKPSAPASPGWPFRILLGLSVLIPVALFVWTAWSERIRVLEEAERSAVRTVEALHEHAVQVLNTHQLVLAEISRQVGRRSWDEIARDVDLRNRMNDLVREVDAIGVLSLIDQTGQVRMTTSDAESANVEHRNFFRVQREPGHGLYVGPTRADEGTGERLIALSRRLDDSDGNFVGVVHATLPLTHLEDFWQRFAPSIAHVIPLVRSDGQVIARYPAVGDTPERLSTTGPFLSRALAQRDGTYTAVSQIDGIERLNAFTRIRNHPLHISFSVEMPAILAAWRERIVVLGLYTALMAAALLGLTLMAIRQYRAQRMAAERWAATADRLATEIAAREDAETALRRAQTLEAVGQLTAGVAHDFNNLLQAIKSGLHLMSRRVPDNARPILDASMQAVDRGAKLVRQLMVFARSEKFEPRPTDLRVLLADMRDLLQKAAGDAVRIETDLGPDLHHVSIDPTQAELAILNLVVNARDAMPAGGTVTLVARNLTVAGNDGASRLPAGDYVRLSVVDTGEGMAPAVVARALEPFFTTKSVGKGTGLGLSMVHGFVEQSGGRLEIDSAVGRGTTVSLDLPKAEAAAAMPDAQVAAVVGSGRRWRILLVDDDALSRLGTAAALREMGHEIFEARDGSEALLVLERHREIEAMVTDYAMPGMDGAALAKSARMARPGLPVIMVTGYAAGMAEHSPSGVLALLRKPFSVEDLAAALDDADAARAAPNADIAVARR